MILYSAIHHGIAFEHPVIFSLTNMPFTDQYFLPVYLFLFTIYRHPHPLVDHQAWTM